MTSHSQYNSSLVPDAATRTAASKDDAREFMSVWTDIVRDLSDYAKKYEPIDAPKWLSKTLQYNVPNGKKNRGLMTVLAYKFLAKEGDLTEENIRLAQYVGWCVEMVKSFNLISFKNLLINKFL